MADSCQLPIDELEAQAFKQNRICLLIAFQHDRIWRLLTCESVETSQDLLLRHVTPILFDQTG